MARGRHHGYQWTNQRTSKLQTVQSVVQRGAQAYLFPKRLKHSIVRHLSVIVLAPGYSEEE